MAAVVPRHVRSVLFRCALNAVRSPMAEGIARYYFCRYLYVASAGMRSECIDPFAVSIMDEVGINLSQHKYRSFKELEDVGFDLIITLSPDAHHQAMELTRTISIAVEY